MNWALNPRRSDRLGCRPVLESLESRQVLSSLPTPSPAEVLTGAPTLWSNYGATGKGLSAAVIDTGINYNNDALGNGFGPGKKVVGGYDLADGDSDPNATWQHGTSVAGLIASSDPQHPGMAPDANLVALRVFGNDNQGDFNRIADALQWVLDHHNEFNITVVNISISDERNYSLNWFANDGGIGQRISGLIHQLRDLRIPVVAAAGNSFKGQQGMGFLAILPETISVTSTDLADKVPSNAQRLGSAVGGNLATDLAAPGVGLVAPSEGDSFTTVDGTSFAAPMVSGAILLLQSVYKQRFGTLPTVSQLEDWLRRGSDPIVDSTTGITLNRLNVARSAQLIPPAPAPQVIDPPPSSPPPASSGGGSTPIEQALTQLYQEGKLVGTVSSNSAGNPLGNAFNAFGLAGSFQTVSTWKGSLLKDAFNSFGLNGSFQTLSTWGVKNGQGPTSTGTAQPSGVLNAKSTATAAPEIARSRGGVGSLVRSLFQKLRGEQATSQESGRTVSLAPGRSHR